MEGKDAHAPVQTEEEDAVTDSDAFSQNEPETQPILENTPPLSFLDDSDDDESTWGWLHPSSSFNLQPLALKNNQYTIGKTNGCDIVIKEDNLNENLPLSAISRKQFKIFKGYLSTSLDEVPQLEDLSMNGTFVNKAKVGIGKKVVLSCGDEIYLVNQHCKVYTFLDTSMNIDWISKEMKKIYSIRAPLGSGAFGEVKLAQNKISGKLVAIKKIKKVEGKENKTYNEVKILQNLKHPCVVTFEQVFETKDSLFIVLEYISGGELARRLQEVQKMSDVEAKAIFYQLVLAIEYLHQKGVAHRDLKPQNVLLCINNHNTERLVKVSDFGLSKLADSTTDLKTFCGTPLYTAPEILATHGTGCYTHQVDVWSLGVILFQCLSGKLPFSKERGPVPVIEQILRGSYSMVGQHWRGVSSNAASLIRKMLKVDPYNRITVDEILNHQWLKDDEMRRKVEKLMQETSPGADENLYVDLVRSAKRPRLEEDTVCKS